MRMRVWKELNYKEKQKLFELLKLRYSVLVGYRDHNEIYKYKRLKNTYQRENLKYEYKIFTSWRYKETSR